MRRADRRDRRGRGPARARLARGRRRAEGARRPGPPDEPPHPPAPDRARRGHLRPGRLREQALADPPRRRDRVRRRGHLPELLVAHAGLQGPPDRAAARALLPRPARPRAGQRLRDRPLALLDQHRAELGARAAAEDDRPQRRDQHGARQHQLDAGPRVGARVGGARRRPQALPAADQPRRVGLRGLRPRAGAALQGRPQPAPRADDDDPDGLREPPAPRRAARFLRLPLPAARALGRPGIDRLLRRPPARRDPRPQRAAPEPLVGHRRRLGRPQLRGRHLQRRARERRPPRPPPGRTPLHRRPRGGSDLRRPRGRDGGRAPGALRRLVPRRDRQLRRPARSRDALSRGEVADRAAARLRLLAGGPAGAARADRPRRQGADRLDGQRRRARGPLRQGALALLLLQAALRPGDEPGDRLGPRAHRDEPDHLHRPAGQPARRGRRPRPAGDPRPPDRHRPRAREAAPDRAPGAARRDDRHHLAADRGRGRASRPRSTGSAPRPRRRSPAARPCWSSPTATSTPTGWRSPRCSRPRPSTTT